MYKAVVQKHQSGCGIACVACVTNQSYEKVLSLTDKSYASSRGYYCKELIALLSKFNLSYSYKKVTNKTKKYLIKEGTIVFIARSKTHPLGHYLVKTKKGWMNSWINYPIISPVKAGFNKRLPGKAQWFLYKTIKS